jgi:GNAT superfamily N-acetyltransferase
MQVRTATLEDVSVIMILVSRVVPLMLVSGNLQRDESYPNAEVFISDINKGQLWLAESDGQIAGVAAITTDQDPEYAEVGWDLDELSIVVHRLAVDPGFQGKGVARALMNHAELVARSKNILVLKVDTNINNALTQSLFPRLGYLAVGEISLNLRPGQRFKCYEKRLQMPNMETFLQKHGQGGFRHAEKLLEFIHSGNASLISTPREIGSSCSYYLQLYRMRAQNLMRFDSTHCL